MQCTNGFTLCSTIVFFYNNLVTKDVLFVRDYLSYYSPKHVYHVFLKLHKILTILLAFVNCNHIVPFITLPPSFQSFVLYVYSAIIECVLTKQRQTTMCKKVEKRMIAVSTHPDDLNCQNYEKYVRSRRLYLSVVLIESSYYRQQKTFFVRELVSVCDILLY